MRRLERAQARGSDDRAGLGVVERGRQVAAQPRHVGRPGARQGPARDELRAVRVERGEREGRRARLRHGCGVVRQIVGGAGDVVAVHGREHVAVRAHRVAHVAAAHEHLDGLADLHLERGAVVSGQGRVVRVVVDRALQRALRDGPRLLHGAGRDASGELRDLDRDRIVGLHALRHGLPRGRRERDARGVRAGEEALVVEELGLEVHVERRGRRARELQHRRREAAREHGLVVRVEPLEAGVGVAAREELGLIPGADVARVLRQMEDDADRRRPAGLARGGRHRGRAAEQTRGLEETGAVDAAERAVVERPVRDDGRGASGEERLELLRRRARVVEDRILRLHVEHRLRRRPVLGGEGIAVGIAAVAGGQVRIERGVGAPASRAIGRRREDQGEERPGSEGALVHGGASFILRNPWREAGKIQFRSKVRCTKVACAPHASCSDRCLEPWPSWGPPW